MGLMQLKTLCNDGNGLHGPCGVVGRLVWHVARCSGGLPVGREAIFNGLISHALSDLEMRLLEPHIEQ